MGWPFTECWSSFCTTTNVQVKWSIQFDGVTNRKGWSPWTAGTCFELQAWPLARSPLKRRLKLTAAVLRRCVGHQQIRFGLFRLFHGGIIGIIQNNQCCILIILLIIVDCSDYSLDYSMDYSMDYSFSLWLFRFFKWIIPIIAFSLYGLFAPDNFQTAFPPSSLDGMCSHFEDSSVSQPPKLERSCQ